MKKKGIKIKCPHSTPVAPDPSCWAVTDLLLSSTPASAKKKKNTKSLNIHACNCWALISQQQSSKGNIIYISELIHPSIDHGDGGLLFFLRPITAAESSLLKLSRETVAIRLRQPSGEGVEKRWDQRLHRQKRNQRQRSQQSRIALAIFSSMYTESKWCLNELEKIKECVDLWSSPSSTRWTQTMWKIWMECSVTKFWELAKTCKGEKLEKWREALQNILQKLGFTLGETKSWNWFL